ncbi:MAG TPA: ATP-binding protein, partial [Polyangiales bacterium]|nr:ATP-binding protein [Polyangiales bacterium]
MTARREGRGGRRAAERTEGRSERRPAKRKPSRAGLGEALWVPDSHAVLDAVLELSRAVTVDAHEDEIMHAYVGAFTRLFPQRMFCVRLFSDDEGSLSAVYATGRLRADKRERLELSREASERHAIDPTASRRTELCIIPQYTPLFVDGASGFDVPMMDGHEVLGLVSVEYPALVKAPKDDRALLVQLTLHFGGALRNARSHRRSVYLRDYLSKLLDHANAPIMVMGKLGEVRLANRAFLGLTSFHRDEVLGKPWMSFLPEAEQRRLWPVYINALRGEPALNVEVRLPRRDGSFAQVSVNAASISGPDGEIEGVMYIYRDVTELRELQEQIIQTEKLATLGQLAAGVVHELNNPLTSICFYSDYLLKKLQRESGDEGDVEKLRRMSVSADRILKFTRDLVTYARPTIETPMRVDLEQIVEQSLGFCSHVIEESGTRVSKRFAHPAPEVFGVKGQLVQVLVNLITNACQAMPLGAGLLHIETAQRDGRFVLSVTDTGRGIPEENLSRVFEPFFTTKGEGQGTGLGLSIVRNIVEQHRGEIEVVSEVGRGTTFEIRLPCRA